MLNFLKKLFGLAPAALTPTDLRSGSIIDVRTAAEFHSGHLSESTNVPLHTLDNKLAQLRTLPQPVITCCRSGTRSALAVRKLRAAGITAVNGGTWQAVER